MQNKKSGKHFWMLYASRNDKVHIETIIRMGWRMSSKVDTAAKVGRLRDDLQNSVKKLAKNWMVVIKIVNIKIFQEYRTRRNTDIQTFKNRIQII